MLNKVKRYTNRRGIRYFYKAIKFQAMAALKVSRLQWIKGLMLFSQVLLLLFTAQWLYSQYNDQQQQLKKNLTKVFVDVQQKISDSLLITNVIDPVSATKAETLAVTSQGPEKMKKIALSPQGMHRILSGATNISGSEAKKLFSTDSIIFNELFTYQMKQNGWNFNAEWINSADSEQKAANAIFINNNGDFFSDANGIVVSNYRHYLFWKIMPQMFFVLVLLVITATAMLVTYKSLRAQMRLSTMKDDFISNVSHELKTPIATVKVALEALSNYGVIDDPKLSREYLGMAASEMDRLELLATRVLNTSLLEAGKISLQQETHSLKVLVEEILQMMQLRFSQNEAKVSFTTSGSSFLVHIDKLHMQGVLVNLLDNSLKYKTGPVNININLTENNGAVQLALSDNGPGIPEEYREKVFEKFFRIPTGDRHNIKGHGLGLNYAAQVMRLHKGNIAVNNIADGGCMFTLTYP